MKYLLVLFLLSIVPATAQQAEIGGSVNYQHEPVEYAVVSLSNTSHGTTTNNSGRFKLENIPPGEYELKVNAPGFLPYTRIIRLSPGDSLQLDLVLEQDQNALDEIIIVGNTSGLTGNTPYNVTGISTRDIISQGDPGGIMSKLREIPGVYGAEFGQAIVKPFIRGLGFTRIVTIYQGNKLENHQWGGDHGLGLNTTGVKRVEVIKGPASVLYGSGALGGVLFTIDSDYYLNSTDFTGNTAVSFNTISNGYKATASIGTKFSNNVFFATDLSYEDHADYREGNGRLIGNSRFNISTLRLHTGYDSENFSNKLSFTLNDQNLGIITDEEMEPEASLATSSTDRNLQLPFQRVKDFILSYNQTYTYRNLETYFHVSHHINNRKEIETAQHLVDLGLLQEHSFFNIRFSLETEKLKHNLGFQGSYLKNKNMQKSLDILIPDAVFFDKGIYYMSSLETNNWFLQGALRYDHRKITASTTAPHFKDREFILPEDPPSGELSRVFAGFTGSIGATKIIDRKNKLKINFSGGFRAPDLAELFSNGPHPGTNRFEQGNVEFERERSLQADLNYSFQSRRLTATISGFGGLIDNYIYFTATGNLAPNEQMELWTYRQTEAFLRGTEFSLTAYWLQDLRFSTSLTGAVARATEKDSGDYISFIPPDNFSLSSGYLFLKDRSLNIEGKLRVMLDQRRTGPNEMSTPGYSLFSIGVSKTWKTGAGDVEAAVKIHNAFNTTYVDHLSLLRAFNIPGPGRNMVFNLGYKF